MRALTEDQVSTLSNTLVKDLAKAIGTGEDNFTFELVATKFFYQAQKVAGYPFIEVLWFPRSQEIQNACAKIITEKVKALAPAEDVAVIFMALPQTAYYENGDHF
ncbi:MAG: DUF1904 domain-containing protein [Bdellovibrio sp.]|nr:DUF1904 domain-containing protein [Bdellovibrio sp.]